MTGKRRRERGTDEGGGQTKAGDAQGRPGTLPVSDSRARSCVSPSFLEPSPLPGPPPGLGNPPKAAETL